MTHSVTRSVARSLLFAGSLFAGTLAAPGCTDNGGNGPGDPGTGGSGGGGGSNTGTAGTGGGAGTGGTSGGGAGGGNPNFMAVPPCNAETDYMGGPSVTFPMSASNFSYSPKCLKVSAGATVVFEGDFLMHPLAPSTKRGTLTGNPITSTASGSTKQFTFASPGFFAYYCTTHGPSDGAAGMVGVVWAE